MINPKVMSRGMPIKGAKWTPSKGIPDSRSISVGGSINNERISEKLEDMNVNRIEDVRILK